MFFYKKNPNLKESKNIMVFFFFFFFFFFLGGGSGGRGRGWELE